MQDLIQQATTRLKMSNITLARVADEIEASSHYLGNYLAANLAHRIRGEVTNNEAFIKHLEQTEAASDGTNP